jgi:hypothetical protein
MSSNLAEQVTLRKNLYGFEMREPDQRRVDPEERKTYEAKAFWQRHHEIVNMAATGMKNVEIASVLNIDPQTVSNVLGSKIAEKKLSELRLIRDGNTKERLAQIEVLTQKAIETYHGILENESGEATLKDRKEVAKDILTEFSGLRVPTKIQGQFVGVQMTPEDFAAFRARGIASSKEAGLVVSDEEGEDLATVGSKISPVSPVNRDNF